MSELQAEKKEYEKLIEELNKRVHLFDEIQKLTKIGVWKWKVNDKTMFWSEEAYRIHGFTPADLDNVKEEYLNKSILCFDENDREIVKKSFEKCVSKGIGYDLEFPFTTVNGKRIWIRTIAKAEKEGNIVVSVIGNFVNITERKKNQILLEESENKYRELFEKSKDAILIIENGMFVDCNQATVEMLGYKNKNELLQTHPSELSPVKQSDNRLSSEKANEMMRIAIENGSNRFEWDHVKANGEVFPVEVLLTPITTEKGKKILHTVWRDITKRKKAENSIKESEEKFRKMAELLPEIVFETDISGNFIFVNNQAFEFFGYSNEDIENGVNLFELILPEERELCQRTLFCTNNQEKAGSTEFTAIRKNGSTFPVLIYSNLTFKDGKQSGLRGIIVDIAERRRLEEQLRQSQKMEAVGQLAGGIAHDFNNLLTVINGYCELLFMKGIPKEFKKPMEQIKSAGEKASKLTAQLLAFSRKQVIEPKVINLNTVVSRQINMLKRVLGEDIEINFSLSSDLRNIKSDNVQIEQIILNMVINARDAMGKDGKLGIKTENVKLDKGDFVMLAISDNGSGMDENTKQHIFEPFYTTKGRGKGTGLGLSTVYGIVNQSGGFINVESKLNEGTSFEIYFPMIKEAESNEQVNTYENEIIGGAETILLAEDDPSVREVTSSTLNTYGYKVITANNGKEALKKYNKHKSEISLLLTDVIMPVMGGKELVEKITQIDPDLKIIFFSGYTDSKIEQEGVLNDKINFIQKPYSNKNLANKIRMVLDK